MVGLVGGIGGPALAAVALAATAILVANGGTGLSDDSARSLFDLAQLCRLASGAFVVLFLLGYGVAALRSRALPVMLAGAACVLAPVFILGPIAALTEDPALRIVVAIAFGLQTPWIFCASLWLALADGVGAAVFVRRAAFVLLVIAAGLVGLALLAVPGATGRFFSWNLQPEPLAAFAGGVYVGSAAVYALALVRPWREVRGLVAGAVVLSVSVFVASVAHRDVFDFDRVQTWAWFVLFAAFGVVTVALLVAGGEEQTANPQAPLPAWSRALLAASAALLAALAIALWVDPAGLTSPSPFELSPLGGRFAGAWVGLLAVVAGWAAGHGFADEAWLPAVALVALPFGALLAALRTLPDLEPAGAAAAYVGALVLVLGSGVAVLGTTRRSRSSA